MRRFAELYEALDASNSTKTKTAAMVAYFADAPAEDAAWAVFFLCGDRLRSPIRSRDMNEWAAAHAGVTDWMFDACYDAVGDKAETIALLVDAVPNRRVEHPWSPSLAEAVAWIEARRKEAPEAQQAALDEAWSRLDTLELFIFNKLMTGALRVGVAKRLVVRALAEWSGVAAHAIFHRLMGHWTPTAANFNGLFSSDLSDADASRPYPYFLASPLEAEADTLGAAADWFAEWKWDGIRGQLVRRRGEAWLWSRGEELVSTQFPEITAAADGLPDGTVLDGEILAWGDDAPLPFADLQRRIGRKQVGRKLLADVPCRFMAYDLLESEGEDLRSRPLRERRERLESLLGGREAFSCSPLVPFAAWRELLEARGSSRARRVEGLMLKRAASAYGVGRERGDWWKWKIDPLEIDAVMIYAQSGHGRRASLYTDYTFAVWNEHDTLVPVAKAYSGLDNAEIRELDRWIRANTIDKFGPVRAVAPEQVFQLHFENVAASKRHKSGVAVRFPRIARWRKDKQPADADTLQALKALIDGSEP